MLYLITKTEEGLQDKLDQLEGLCSIDGNTTEAIQEEMQALKFALEQD